MIKYPFPLPLLYPAVFLSGATALVYEIVWARHLALTLGSTMGATTAVLSAFMLGLALGALLVGRRVDRSTRPLRWYALLEIALGIYAFAFAGLLDLVGERIPGGPWLTAFLILLVPSALMGATLPVLARAAADTTDRGTRALGSLYGINTLGAVAGALATTFLLLESVGLSGATTIAAVTNLLLGAGFWALNVAAGEREVFVNDEEDAPPPRGWTGDAELPVVIAFCVAGFAGLALETAWVRLLVYFLEGFTIAFGLMLATYLLGLGLGAVGGTFLALRSGNPRRLLARLFLLEAVLALGTFLFADGIGLRLEEMRSGYNEAAAIDFEYGLGLFWAAAAIILPGTIVAGMLMPVVARITLCDREAIGRHCGVVYAASTLGAVVAPPVAAFWIIPAVGVPGTIALSAALVLAAGTWLAVPRGVREWAVAGGAAVAFVAVCLVADLGRPLVTRSHVFTKTKQPRRLIEFREGVLAGVSVVEELSDGARRLYLDGFSAAETGRHYGYMRMLGHLPVLLHPAPRDVCVIAFGTGTTAGAVSLHPEVERLTCVEIEPAVYEVADAFGSQNRGVLEQPRTTAVVADGREFVRRGPNRFDVVTLEPLMPYTPAAVYLYTREFYDEARGALKRGGLLCQWIPPQGVSAADTRRLIASMTAVFPHVSLWYYERSLLVVGGEAAPTIDARQLQERVLSGEILDDLKLCYVGTPGHLLAAHVVSGEALVAALEGVEPMSDDRTDLEFRPLPRRFGQRQWIYVAQNLEFLRDVREDEVEWLEGAAVNIDVALASERAVLATLATEMRRRAEGGKIVPASVLDDTVRRDKASLHARAVIHRRRYEELVAERPGEAAELSLAPDRSAAYLALAAQPRNESRRIYYLTLAVRQNALLPEPALRELAEALDGPQQRFCLNRIRAQKGEPLEEGEEELPAIPVPDIRTALDAQDWDAARAALDAARQADLVDQVEGAVWDWWGEVKDKNTAVRALHRIGSVHVLRASLSVYGRGLPEGLVSVAPYFCSIYPQNRNWAKLCTHQLARVRAAAADEARKSGSKAHLETLALMCAEDKSADVRLSAYLAFRGLLPGADVSGYDPRDPTPESTQALLRLARE